MIDIASKINLGKGLLKQFSYFVELQKSYFTGSVPGVLPFLYIDLLKDCNLSCRHCGYANDYPEEGTILSTNDIYKIIEDAKKLSTEIISFGGGEPFLRDDIFQLISFTQKMGIAVHINTNATLLTEHSIKKLVQFDHLTIIVSLDHPDSLENDKIRGQGVYQRVISAIRLLKQYAPNVNLGINCVIGAHNIDRLTGMIKLGSELRVKSVKFSPVHENLNHQWKSEKLSEDYALTQNHCERLNQEIEKLIKLARKKNILTNTGEFLRGISGYIDRKTKINCYAGYIYGNIDPYGNLFPCYDYKMKLNVRTMGLVKAWKSDEMQLMRKKVKNCEHKCWNTGNSEPSLRMNFSSILKNPGQIINDYKFYLK